MDFSIYPDDQGNFNGKSNVRFIRRRKCFLGNLSWAIGLVGVGSPIPSIATLVSPLLPSGPHLSLGGQWASIRLWLEVCVMDLLYVVALTTRQQ